MRRAPVALAIGGLDPSSGAGIAADLRGFAAAGVWGAAACAALTVQSTRGVVRVRAVPAGLLAEQVREVRSDMVVAAIKTGALGSRANVDAVARLVSEGRRVPVVVDPVGAATRGARLDGGATRSAWLELARAATIVTPNLPEAASLLGWTARDGREAALALLELGVYAALVKGGHARGRDAVDWLACAGDVVAISLPRRRIGEVHGTGCVLASLLAGRLVGAPSRPSLAELTRCVRWARARLDRALAAPLAVGRGLPVLSLQTSSRSPRRAIQR